MIKKTTKRKKQANCLRAGCENFALADGMYCARHREARRKRIARKKSSKKKAAKRR